MNKLNLRAEFKKLINLFAKKDNTPLSISNAPIRRLVDWLTSEYITTDHKAEVTNSEYVYILSPDSNERICRIRISDHADAFGGKDLYIVTSVNDSRYIVYLEEVRMPMIFEYEEVQSFIKHFILIKYSSKVANKVIDASNNLKRSQSDLAIDPIEFPTVIGSNNEPINEPENEPENESDLVFDIELYNDLEYRKSHWNSFWNEYLIKEFPKLPSIQKNYQTQIKLAFCADMTQGKSIETIVKKFRETHNLFGGKCGKYVAPFVSWVDNGCDESLIGVYNKDNKKSIEVKEISETVKKTYATYGNRDRYWRFFVSSYLAVKFPSIDYSKLDGGSKNLLHQGYCSNLAVSLDELDNVLIQSLETTKSEKEAMKYFVKVVKNAQHILELQKDDKKETSKESNTEIVKTSDSINVEIQLDVKNDEDNQTTEEPYSRFFEYDKMTIKQKMVVGNLLDHKELNIDDIVNAINEANKYGRDIKRMRRASEKLLKNAA